MIRFFSLTIALAALWGMGPLIPRAAGQEGRNYKPPVGPAPRKANGKPDFGGVWLTPRLGDDKIRGVDVNVPLGKVSTELPFTPWGKERWESYDAAKGDYAGSCLPFGLLRSIGGQPIQIVQDDKYIAVLYEQNSWFHVTPLDGRPHLKDPNPTWFGNSVGHWEGDTLVIDTVAFNGKIRIDTIGHPVSDQLHTIERFTRRDLGHIDYVVTIDDPKTYTKPWDIVGVWTLRSDWEILEYSCEENNKDLYEGHIKQGTNP